VVAAATAAEPEADAATPAPTTDGGAGNG
jgi:hypothetical protein